MYLARATFEAAFQFLKKLLFLDHQAIDRNEHEALLSENQVFGNVNLNKIR